MLAIKIDNPEIESKFKEYAKQQKKAIEDVISEAMKLFLDTHKKDNEIIYIKKDPMQHIFKIDDFGYKPDTKLADGIGEFVKCYREFYGK